jgi:hypothetical protein
MDGGTDYDNFDVNSPLALIVGGEGRGISRMISEECDYLVKLPMRGKIGSLNASVAAGIVLYEIGRRRGTAGQPKASAASQAEVSTDEEEAVLQGEIAAEVAADDELELEDELALDAEAEEAEEEASGEFEEILEDVEDLEDEEVAEAEEDLEDEEVAEAEEDLEDEEPAQTGQDLLDSATENAGLDAEREQP